MFFFLAFLLPLSAAGVRSKCGYGAPPPPPSPSCLSGAWFFPPQPSYLITFTIFSSTATAVTYNVTAERCSWASATATFPVGSPSFTITFDESPPLTMPGFPDSNCTLIDWGGQSPRWCRDVRGCDAPPPPVPPFWSDGHVHLVEVSHSDIGWLGVGRDPWGPGLPDLIDDTTNIGLALDMMAADPAFVWQHECILFLRCFVEMFPQREGELVARIAEGRFDVGGTFTEPLEGTLLNELLARQMYTGRKWFVERYPDLDSAVVAFHQDGPLRSLQMPQLYRKAGMRYMKTSRWSDNFQLWCGADDVSCLLSMTEVHYGQADCTVADTNARLAHMYAKYAAAGLPPQAVQALGIDYSPPINYSALLSQWANQSGGAHATMGYSTFHAALRALDVGAPGIRRVKGERPNLWYIEGCPPHHNLCTFLREGARALPSAELWGSLRALALDGGWARYPAGALDEAWLNLTLNDHGIAGEPTPRNFSSLPRWFINEYSPPFWDLAYADKWGRARDAGVALGAAAQGAVAAAVDPAAAPPGATGAFTVFNGLSWERSAGAGGPVEVPLPACEGLAIVDAAGAEQPSQAAAAGGAGGCALVFLATGVPSLGYKTFYTMPRAGAAPAAARGGAPAPGEPWAGPWANSFFNVTPSVGGIKSLVDLASGLEVFNTSIYGAGEWMELTYTGMGASETRSYDSATRGAAFSKLSDFPAATWACVESGPVRTVFATAPVATAHSVVTLTLTAYAAVPILQLGARLENWDSAFGVANRLAFPLATPARNVSYAAPFGVVRVGVDEAEDGEDDVWLTNPGPEVPPFERGWLMHPREISDWMAAEGAAEGGGAPGLLIGSSVGTFDWVDGSGAYPADRVVLAPELMLHTNSNRGPYLPEPGQHSFSFTLFPLAPGRGGWRGAWRWGVEGNNPLVATPVAPVAGAGGGAGAGTGRAGSAPALPPSGSLLGVSGDAGGSWVTAAKKQDDGVAEARGGLVVRLFNVDGVDRNVTITLAAGALAGVDAVDLIERNAVALPGWAGGNSFQLALGHWAVETLLLDVGL